MTGERATAVHTRILQDFEVRILSGQWHSGYRIPTEHEIAASYGCSRPTVAKALMLLEQKGMIERRKRAGTFVKRPPAQSIILQILDPASDIEARGQRHTFELTAREQRPAGPGDRRQLHLKRGPVLEVTTLHRADGVPYCLDRRLFNLSLLPEAAEVDFEKVEAAGWLIDRLPWRRGDNLIRAMEADARLAQALDVPTGAALLVIERMVHVGEGQVAHGLAWYPAAQVELKSHYRTGLPGPSGAPSGGG
ncbi:UTRA domain-containing protein [Frigidibacter sp. ROC022]|uniref:UTRA domain-containing protein n=1 Tax=Frigidibacter sp. ROC022 TaxID=2971796 RepID=UPI00215AEEC2|nr:UTRA domain-containing protein [Frigidibacter sp. ROC022]MCR8725421.1 UTRA domain-containing protein [Frigidibacter sp. ROC022]